MLDHFVQEYIDIAQKEGTHANHALCARTHAVALGSDTELRLSGDHLDRPSLVEFARTALSEVAHQPNAIRPIGKVVSFKRYSSPHNCNCNCNRAARLGVR
jgi:hypothetical protein